MKSIADYFETNKLKAYIDGRSNLVSRKELLDKVESIPLLASLTSEAWMETRAGAGGGGNGGFFEAQEEKAGERERGREKQQRPPRTRATAAAATPGWKSSSAAAAAAAPSASGFLAPVEALAATTKRARLRQRG